MDRRLSVDGGQPLIGVTKLRLRLFFPRCHFSLSNAGIALFAGGENVEGPWLPVSASVEAGAITRRVLPSTLGLAPSLHCRTVTPSYNNTTRLSHKPCSTLSGGGALGPLLQVFLKFLLICSGLVDP